MDQIKRQIAKKLRDQLPEDRDFYRLDELRALGLPNFLKQRIRVELERRLSESMQMPSTEWADMEAETIQSLWAQFEHAIRQEAYLPATSAPSVLNMVVEDVLDMLVLPREKLPDIIYGDDVELNYDQLIKRLEVVVVYRHFATLIPRYMQRKEVQKLSKERCAAIIERADERLTSRYTPLNWAQMLEQLFQLSNQKIDPELLSRFFEDKKKPKLAKLFDSVNAAVSRNEFIEILSSPSSLELDERPVRNEEKSPPSEAVENKDNSDLPEVGKEHFGQAPGSPSKERKPSRTDRETDEDPIVGAFHKFRQNLHDNETQEVNSTDAEESADETSLNDIFIDKDENKDTSEVFTEDKPMSSGESEESNGFSGDQNKKRSIREDEESEDDGSEVVESFFGQQNSDGETPMWQRFLGSEELTSLEEESPSGPLDGTFSPVRQDNTTQENKKFTLREELRGDEDFFIKELFRGSEETYNKALKEIANCNDWRSASKYISEYVFKKNLVDMYSEAAVEFTDRLHAYFMEKSKS